jgi:hypothetical protein
MPGQHYFSEAMARSVHPNVLTYGGHGTKCTSCPVGSEPQRGNVTDYTATGATGCLHCEVLGPGMYSADGLRCVVCPDSTRPNSARSGCVPCASGHFGVGGACERCLDGTQPNATKTGCDACPPLMAGRDGFCDNCPNGTRVLRNGTDKTDCEICPEGWVGTGSVCRPCGVGTLPNFPNAVEPPVWDGVAHTWVAVPPARTACLPCPQYMYSPAGKECFWCGPGEVVNSDRTGCEDCPVGQYGLVDDPMPGQHYFSEAMARSVHPNVLTYGGHGTKCTSCPAGSEPQRGNVTDYTATGATGCLHCEVLGPGMYSADGLRCVVCPDSTRPNSARSGCVDCPVGFSGSRGQCDICAPGFSAGRNFTFVQVGAPGQACRAMNETDRSKVYYTTPAAAQGADGSARICQEMCARRLGCDGFGYSTVSGICHHWNRAPLPASASTLGDMCYEKLFLGLVNTICIPCNSTSWSIQGVCFQCADGTRPNPSRTGCDSCTAGEAGRNGECRTCPAGRFVKADHTECISCEAGKFSANGTTCEYCVGDGKYTPPGGISCVACQPGTYSNHEHSGCLVCGVGQYGVAGVCHYCADGSQPDAMHRSCTTCPDHFYGIRGQCTVCLDGKYPHENKTACLECRYGDAGTGGVCETCSEGKRPNALLRATECLRCDFGKYSPNGKECLWCKAGYRPNPSKTACIGCLEGWFSNDIMNATHTGIYCRRCEPGHEPNARLFADGCTRCSSNRYSAGNGSFCVTCGNGEQPNPTQTGCEQCPVAYAGKEGRCSECPAGRTPDVLQVTCVECPHATFGFDGTCTLCEDGKEPNSAKTSCQTCAYAHVGVRGECHKCEEGTQSNYNATKCNRCEPNQISPAGETCQLCPPGSRAWIDNLLCTLCPAGQYKSDMRNVSCAVCPIGHRPNAGFRNGSTSCELCPVDTISTDGLSCRSCSNLIGQKSASNEDRTSCHCINGTEYRNKLNWTGQEWIDLGSSTAGCHDINECRDIDPCDMLVKCINLPKVSPVDDGFQCTACPAGYVGDGVKAHGGCFSKMVHVTGGEEPLEPTFPMRITVSEATNIGGHMNPPSAAQAAYRLKLAAGIADKIGVAPSLIEISYFNATALASTGAGRRLATTSWDVSFEFAVKSRSAEIIADLEIAFNSSQHLDIIVDGETVTMSFPINENIDGTIQENTHSLYTSMQIKCPILTFREANSSTCKRCDPGHMVNADQTGCMSCSLFRGKYSPDGTPCVACQPGSEPNNDVTGCAGCPQNYYSRDGIACQRCPPYQVTRLLPMQTSSDACVCERNMYNQTLQSPHLTCFKWNGVQLAVASTDAAGPCRRCPEDEKGQLYPCVSCDHGFNSSALLMPGYWRTESVSPHIFQCEFGPAACLGQWGGLDQDSMPLWAYGGCGVGYSGITCASCIANYRRLKTGCKKCPGDADIKFWASAGAFAALAVALIWCSNTAVAAPSIRQAMRSGATAHENLVIGLRTLLSYCTIQALIGEMDNRWPTVYESFFWFYGIASDVSHLVEFSRCASSSNPFWTDSVPFVVLKAKMTIVLPYVAVVSIAAFYTMRHCAQWTYFQTCKRICKRRKGRYTVNQGYTGPPRSGTAACVDDILAAVTLILYLLHPAVMHATLSLFPCRQLAGGIQVMVEDTGVHCTTPGRKTTLGNFGVPSVAIVCVAMPLAAAWCGWRLKRADRLRQPRVQRRYGWLLRGYVDSCCCWELVVTLRKVGAALTVVLLRQYGPEVQALGMLAVLQMALVAHLSQRPFCQAAHNALEGLCLSLHVITVVTGIFFRAALVGQIGVAVDGNVYNLVTVLTAVLNCTAGGAMLFVVFTRIWREKAGVSRMASHPGQDREEVKALATNHRANLIQRFLHKARSLEDSALTIETLHHQLQHMLLLLPEQKGDLHGLLSRTDRMRGMVADAQTRALEVQRKYRNEMPYGKRVQSDSNLMLAMADKGQIADETNSSPATPPDQQLQQGEPVSEDGESHCKSVDTGVGY